MEAERKEIVEIDAEIGKLCSRLHQLQDRRLEIICGKDNENEVPDRFTLQHLKDVDSYKLFQLQINAFWQSDEISLSNDLKDYRSLKPELRRVLDACLSFLSRADIVLIDAMMTRLYFISETPEEKCYYSAQSCMEAIHSQAYAQFIDAIAPSKEEKERIFRVADTIQSGKLKSKWMEKHLKEDCGNARLIAVYTCTEGIFFLSPFMIQFWFKTINKMSGILFGNELISRDERLHLDKGICKYNSLPPESKLKTKEFTEIITEAVEMEIAFTREILPEPIDDLHPEDIISYIKVLGDNILERCGYPAHYGVNKETIPSYVRNGSLDIKTNFYEGTVGSYSQSVNGVSKSINRLYQKDYAKYV